MKQHITRSDLVKADMVKLEKLLEGKERSVYNNLLKYLRVFESKDNKIEILEAMARIFTIGKMIEILQNELDWNMCFYTYERYEDEVGFKFEGTHEFDDIQTEGDTLCDALWEAILIVVKQ